MSAQFVVVANRLPVRQVKDPDDGQRWVTSPGGLVSALAPLMRERDQVAWVALPGEVFVQLGLAIKDASPFPATIVVELANGSIGG